MRDWELNSPFLTAWLRLRQAYRAAMRVAESEVSEFGGTIAQVDVLIMLNASKEPLTPGEISSYLLLDTTGTSALLTRMQKAGLVEKLRNMEDQRVVKIRMLPKGKDLLTKASKFHGRTCVSMEECFSEEEASQFDSFLKRYRDHCLQRVGEEARPLPPVVDVEILSAWL